MQHCPHKATSCNPTDKVATLGIFCGVAPLRSIYSNCLVQLRLHSNSLCTIVIFVVDIRYITVAVW